MRKEFSAERYPCNIVPGKNCFNCPYEDCISIIGNAPISLNEQAMIKCGLQKSAVLKPLAKVGLSKKQKELITSFSKKAYQSNLKTYKRSKKWIDKELSKLGLSSFELNDNLSSFYSSQADVSYSFYYF